MKFLFACSNKIKDKFIIKTQELWEDNFYDKQVEKLTERSYSQSFSNDCIKKYNDEILELPRLFIKAANPDKSDILGIIKQSSETALYTMIKKTEIAKFYPFEKEINYKKHDVDKLFKNYVNNIVNENPYRFLNILDTNKYVEAIYSHWENSILFSSILINECKLYNKFKDCVSESVISYNEDLKLAHVTQLFPILEDKIRKMCREYRIASVKIDSDDFMSYKDPSSLLREIIQNHFYENNDFDGIEDILFIYNCMYNSNFLNIRNECIHGRNYNRGSSLMLAFKVTLLCILMIYQRLDNQ